MLKLQKRRTVKKVLKESQKRNRSLMLAVGKGASPGSSPGKIMAQGKRSDALGSGRKMSSSFFSFWFGASEGAPNQKEKKEIGWVGFLPGAAASAALPRAIIRPPLRG